MFSFNFILHVFVWGCCVCGFFFIISLFFFIFSLFIFYIFAALEPIMFLPGETSCDIEEKSLQAVTYNSIIADEEKGVLQLEDSCSFIV